MIAFCVRLQVDNLNVQPLFFRRPHPNSTRLPHLLNGNEAWLLPNAVQMANELADFDEQLDEIISSHKVKKSKEKRILRKKELKTQNSEKISSLKYEKLIRKSNQTLALQILG